MRRYVLDKVLEDISAAMDWDSWYLGVVEFSQLEVQVAE